MSEEAVWENEGGFVEPAKGTVQSLKDVLAEKETSAHEQTPEGMVFVGWLLNGWVATYPLIDDSAYPVYSFPRD